MNREVFPYPLYPLTGDAESQAGNTGVTVAGIQNVPVANTLPSDGNVLTYVEADQNWTPAALPIATISQLGIVEPDGMTITVTAEGVISATTEAPATHAEPLTDGDGNFIFAATLTTGGDVIVVLGVPN